MNFDLIKKIAALHNSAEVWDVKPGQEVEIYEKIKEGNSERIWKFKGLIISVKRPNLHTGTFTVRGKVLGVDVEKIYPLDFKGIEKIVLLDEKKVRRAKLYFIREKIGKAAKLKSLLQGERAGEKGKLIGKRKIVDLDNEKLKSQQAKAE